MLSKKAVYVGDGSDCPKGHGRMGRFAHPQGWSPVNKAYWFAWWDKCHCGHIQHYEVAKRSGAVYVPEFDFLKEKPLL